jgi:hypothetical protein
VKTVKRGRLVDSYIKELHPIIEVVLSTTKTDILARLGNTSSAGVMHRWN